MLHPYASRIFRAVQRLTFAWLFCVLPLTASLAMGQPVLVKDVDQVTVLEPQHPTPANGTLSYVAGNGAHGSQLRKRNGTVLVKNFFPESLVGAGFFGFLLASLILKNGIRLQGKAIQNKNKTDFGIKSDLSW